MFFLQGVCCTISRREEKGKRKIKGKEEQKSAIRIEVSTRGKIKKVDDKWIQNGRIHLIFRHIAWRFWSGECVAVYIWDGMLAVLLCAFCAFYGA
jgi:hypothetical protein